MSQSEHTSGEALVERARAMTQALRSRGESADANGRIPEETIRELAEAGLFRAVVPRRFGGHEIPFRYVPQIFRELGRGCTSTAWTMGFLIYHNFQFAHFSETAQQEVWGSGRGYTMAPGQVMPAGQAVSAEGGYKLTGRWGYATGIFHGDWMLLSAPVKGGAMDGEILRFFVPVGEFRILDTWRVSAMRATGSHDVELNDVFVPAHRAIRVADLRGGAAPGLQHNSGSVYRMPLLTFMSFGAVGPLLGGAEAMFELITESLRNKVRAYSQAQAQQQMSTRVRIAELKCALDSLRALFDGKIAYVDGIVETGGQLTREERAEMRAVVSYIAKTSQTLVNALAREGGSRAIYLDSPLQRFQRDVNALATHALFDMDQNGDLFGRALLGLEIPAQAMI